MSIVYNWWYWNNLLMSASVVYNIQVLGHFDEECVNSIQFGAIGTFYSIRTILVKNCTRRIRTIQKDFLNFQVWYFNQNCSNTPKCPDTPQWYTSQLYLTNNLMNQADWLNDFCTLIVIKIIFGLTTNLLCIFDIYWMSTTVVLVKNDALLLVPTGNVLGLSFPKCF